MEPPNFEVCAKVEAGLLMTVGHMDSFVARMPPLGWKNDQAGPISSGRSTGPARLRAAVVAALGTLDALLVGGKVSLLPGPGRAVDALAGRSTGRPSGGGRGADDI